MSTKEKLVTVATKLFLGRGYGVVGTSEICKTAQVNKGTFYHFFPSKSDLLIASIKKYARNVEGQFIAVAQSNACPHEKLIQIFEVPAAANTEWKKRYGCTQGCLVGNMALELGAVDDAVREASHEALCSWREALTPIVHELVEAKHISPIDAAQGAEVILTLLQGAAVLAKCCNDPACIRATAPAAIGALKSKGAYEAQQPAG